MVMRRSIQLGARDRQLVHMIENEDKTAKAYLKYLVISFPTHTSESAFRVLPDDHYRVRIGAVLLTQPFPLVADN